MNFTRAAIRNNRVTFVTLLVLVAAGIIAYSRMPQDEDPGFIIRVAQVTTYFPGASPERVEQLVTDKLEKAIQEIPELDFLTSQSKSGVSVIFVNIKESYTEMRPIWDDLRRKVDRAKGDLPENVNGPFVNDDFGDVFGIVIALTGDGYTYAELKEIADDVRSELLFLEDVAKVDIHGIQDERIHVEYNNARLAELGLSPTQLSEILESRNIVIPGGEIYTADEQIVLEPTGNFDSLEDMRKTVIKLPGRKDVLYLGDLAYIKRDYLDPPTSKVRYAGRPALAIAINMREGGNIIRLGNQAKTQVDRFRRSYPAGIGFDIVAFQPVHVQKKVTEFLGSLFLGLRTGLVVASLIPMAMITAIYVMSLFHIGIDQMSLASLMISLGLLVDNAIVMSESIMVQMADGVKPVTAALDSASELRVPLLISSLTTSAAFLPIYLAESDVGEYTAPLFKVVTITLLCSWILATTMTPMFCVNFLKVKKSSPEEARYGSRFYRLYRRFLLGILGRPLLSMLVAASLFGASIFGFRYIPNIFFPENDKAIFYAELKLPIGTPLSKTEEVVKEIEIYMEKELRAGVSGRKEGIIDWATFLGEGAPRFFLSYGPEPPSPEYAYMLINGSSLETIRNELIPKMECTSVAPGTPGRQSRRGANLRQGQRRALRDLAKRDGEAFGHSRDEGRHGRLGAADQETPREDQPATGPSRRSDQHRCGRVASNDIERNRNHGLSRGGRNHPGHASLRGRRSERHRQVGVAQYLCPNDGQLRPAQAGRGHRDRLGAGKDPAQGQIENRHRAGKRTARRQRDRYSQRNRPMAYDRKRRLGSRLQV
jgi:multidrug efflux pump subunit AcrB